MKQTFATGGETGVKKLITNQSEIVAEAKKAKKDAASKDEDTKTKAEIALVLETKKLRVL